MAGEGLGGIVRDVFYLGHCITDGNGEAGTAQQGNVRKIVANERDKRIGNARFSEEFLRRLASLLVVSCKQIPSSFREPGAAARNSRDR